MEFISGVLKYATAQKLKSFRHSYNKDIVQYILQFTNMISFLFAKCGRESGPFASSEIGQSITVSQGYLNVRGT